MKFRYARFVRQKSLRPIFIKDQEIQILSFVMQYRLLTAKHIAALVNIPFRTAQRRLSELFHNEYLDRPRAQRWYQNVGGRCPIIYAIASKGARMLKERSILKEHSSHWATKNKNLTGLFLNHQLGISDYLVSVECVARNEGRNYMNEAVLSRNDGYSRFQWSVDVTDNTGTEKLYIIPDGAFSIKSPAGERLYFFLEYDRGTMPLKRKTLQQTSYYRKLVTYYETWRTKHHCKQFGWSRFRVITITSSAERRKGILELASSIAQRGGTGVFLVTDVDLVRNAKTPFDIPFYIPSRPEPMKFRDLL